MRILYNIVLTILTLFCYQVYGATICAKNNSYVDFVKGSINGNSTEYDNDIKIWKIAFDYKTITGLASCSGTRGTVGEALTNFYTTYMDSGTHCWCKMEPVEDYGYETGLSSYWVYYKEYTSVDDCFDLCTRDCVNAISSNITFRTSVFEAIW